MGMHFGILAANAPWPTVQSNLSRIGEIRPAGPSHDFEKLKSENTDCFLLVAGEYVGKAYVMDESFMLSMAYPDFIVALSDELACRIVGCGAETVSGSFDFNLADKGALERLYHQCNMSISQPFALGTPMVCEKTIPYDQLDGEGLVAALREAGFDYDGFYEKGNHSCYYFKPNYDAIKEIESGVLGKQLQEHHAKYKWPEGQAPQPGIVFRGVVQQPSGFWGWLRSLFGGR
jgi:hypothetical protein